MSELQLGIDWLYSEMDLGSIYDASEYEAIISKLGSASNPNVGFSSTQAHVERFEKLFASYVGTNYAVALCNAGVGIDLLLEYLALRDPCFLSGIALTQSINYKAVPMALVRRGMRVEYVDVAPLSLLPSISSICEHVRDDVRLIFLTHMNGFPVDIAGLRQELISRGFEQIVILEDCARSLGATHLSRVTGSLGFAGVHSFQSKKIITTLGEGGMVTTNDSDLAAFLMERRQYGLETGLGSNYKLTEIQAIVGVAQLNKLETFLGNRRQVACWYASALETYAHVKLPFQFNQFQVPAFYTFPILLSCPSPEVVREKVFKDLDSRYRLTLSISNPMQNLRWPALSSGYSKKSKFTNALETNSRMISLPVHPSFSKSLVCDIVSALSDSVTSFVGEY